VATDLEAVSALPQRGLDHARSIVSAFEPYDADQAAQRDQILAFGKKLRRHFHENLPRYADAVTLADRRAFYPLHADFLSRLAMTFDQGDYAHIADIPGKARTAERLYRRALAYHPEPRAYLGLGIMAQKRRDYAGSVGILTDGIGHFPSESSLNICLAVSFMNQAQFERGLELLLPFQHVAESRPLIAGCYRALGQTEKAAVFETRTS